MSRVDVYSLLFRPGFSTKDQVDDFAGRGVGMDVVRTSLGKIQGAITIDSTLGRNNLHYSPAAYPEYLQSALRE